MLRPSFVPPPAIRRLRDLTRYRIDLVATRTAEQQRVEKLLEDAQIKLSVVASDIFGASGRAMLAALVAGERDPKALAQLARTRLRAKLALLEEAFTGRFGDHHAFLLATMLGRIDQASADIAELDRKIEEEVAPFAAAVERLDEVTGIGRTAAQVIIAELGVDMGRFPTPGHLASWAKFAPGVKESAGKRKGTATSGHGDRYLARVLGEAAVAAGRTNTFLGERYRRIARRRGAKRAIVAVGRSILVIIWHLSASAISAPASTTPESTLSASSATMSANSKRSATRSPFNPPPPDQHPSACWTRLRCAAPGAAACPLTIDFRIRRGAGQPRARDAGRRGLGLPARHDGPDSRRSLPEAALTG
jgi:transposase